LILLGSHISLQLSSPGRLLIKVKYIVPLFPTLTSHRLASYHIVIMSTSKNSKDDSFEAERDNETGDKSKEVMAVKETRPTFMGLKHIEKKRRILLLRAELPFWRILLFWSGTCLKDISTDSLVWFTMSIYVFIRVVAYNLNYVPDSVTLLENTNIGVLGGFLSFFLVLFVNQTNGRFLEMYGFSKACSGRIQDVAGMARTLLPKEMGEKLVKHFNAAHVAGYTGINCIGHGSPYSKTYFFNVYNEQNNLLTPEELKCLEHHDMDNSGLCMKELVTWCQQDIANARKEGYLDTYQETYMQDRVLQFRAAMDGMYDYSDQPPHFFYIHFLVLLSALYLPLFAIDTAYATGWGEDTYLGLDVLNGVIVFLQCIFVVGLRSLGTKMIDPYGDDLEDLSVILYVEATLEICDTIMHMRQPATDPDSRPVSNQMIRSVPSKDVTWDTIFEGPNEH